MAIHKEQKHQERAELSDIVRKAASMAVDFVSSGMVVGLGTGRAAGFAIEELASRVNSELIENIVCIPSSIKTANLAKSLGLKIGKFSQSSAIDITIDGADEVNRDLKVIKGGGGAMLREKIVAQESSRNIIVIDGGKVSEKLGTRCRVPVEVVPFSVTPARRFIFSLGAVSIDIRRNKEGRVFKTDQNNNVLDCDFGPIYDPQIIAESLVWRAGIVEHGLFLTTTTDILVSTSEGMEHLRAE